MAVLVILHLSFLHEVGSTNPLGVEREVYCVPFHPYFTTKDAVGFSVFGGILMGLVCFFPEILGNVDNWVPADPIKTPENIQPEWYFLYLYTVLRSVPNKTGGVVAIFRGVLILLFVPVFHSGVFTGLSFYPLSQAIFWM